MTASEKPELYRDLARQLEALLGMLLDSDSVLKELSVIERQQLESAHETVHSLLLRAQFDDPGEVNAEES